MVSWAMRWRFSGDRWPSVRMLCIRSASLTRITRTSAAIASSSLRKFSAWAVSVEVSSSWVSLVTPSTRSAISAPNRRDISSRVAGVSSMVSCNSAVTIEASSSCSSVRIAATSSGWPKNGSPLARF
jgi:hypothetical protein